MSNDFQFTFTLGVIQRDIQIIALNAYELHFNNVKISNQNEKFHW